VSVVDGVYAPLHSATATVTCCACVDSFQLREVVGLLCGHAMCLMCWRRMLAAHLNTGQANLRCVGYKCSRRVEEGVFLSLLDGGGYRRYRRFLQDGYILLRGMRWCVSAKCSLVAEALTAADEFDAVHCHCGAQAWCFSCGLHSHWPSSCAVAGMYEGATFVRNMRAKLIADDGSHARRTAQYIQADMKKCPRCKTSWERNGGCNHFKCGSCQHDFCCK
jgi:ariadne-1